jgi:hypothetical protein
MSELRVGSQLISQITESQTRNNAKQLILTFVVV